MAAPIENDFFQRPGLLWFIVVMYGMALATVAPFRIDLVPCDYLGPIGNLVTFLFLYYRFVLVILPVVAWVLHLGEAIYAYKLCKQKNISKRCTMLWVIQTFLLGLPSLRILSGFEPPQRVEVVTRSGKKRR